MHFLSRLTILPEEIFLRTSLTLFQRRIPKLKSNGGFNFSVVNLYNLLGLKTLRGQEEDQAVIPQSQSSVLREGPSVFRP